MNYILHSGRHYLIAYWKRSVRLNDKQIEEPLKSFFMVRFLQTYHQVFVWTQIFAAALWLHRWYRWGECEQNEPGVSRRLWRDVEMIVGEAELECNTQAGRVQGQLSEVEVMLSAQSHTRTRTRTHTHAHTHGHRRAHTHTNTDKWKVDHCAWVFNV